jgi:hypothetical protein
MGFPKRTAPKKYPVRLRLPARLRNMLLTVGLWCNGSTALCHGRRQGFESLQVHSFQPKDCLSGQVEGSRTGRGSL